MVFGAGCFALYVANTWNADVSVTGDINGTTIDLSKYTYLPSGSGQSLTMTAIGQGGKIPVGKVGIIFLREGMYYSTDLDTSCNYGVTVAEKDPRLRRQTDPASGTSNAAKAIHVVASAPVVVYDVLPFGGGRSEVADGSLLLPTSTWDTNYIAITPVPLGNNCTNPGISIISSSDNNTVTIKPSVAIASGTGVNASAANTPVNFTLSKGQVLRFEQAEDLLGSIISSTSPIGLWGEQSCINIDASACDGAHEQIPPVTRARQRVRLRAAIATASTTKTRRRRRASSARSTERSSRGTPRRPARRATINTGQSFEVRSSGPFVVKSQDDQHPFYVATVHDGRARRSRTAAATPSSSTSCRRSSTSSKYVFFTDPTYPETNLVFMRKKGADNAFQDVTLDCAGTLTRLDSRGIERASTKHARDLVRHNFAGQNGCDNGRTSRTATARSRVTVWGWGTSETTIYSQYTSYAYPAGASVQSINTVIVPPN